MSDSNISVATVEDKLLKAAKKRQSTTDIESPNLMKMLNQPNKKTKRTGSKFRMVSNFHSDKLNKRSNKRLCTESELSSVGGSDQHIKSGIGFEFIRSQSDIINNSVSTFQDDPNEQPIEKVDDYDQTSQNLDDYDQTSQNLDGYDQSCEKVDDYDQQCEKVDVCDQPCEKADDI